MEPSNPYASPQSDNLQPSPTPGDGLQEIAPGSDPIDVGACVKRGFELTKRHFGVIFSIGLVYVLTLLVLSIVLDAIDSALGFGGDISYGSGDPSGSLLNQIVFNVTSTFLSLGLCRVGLNLVSGTPAAVGQLFGEGSKLLRAVGASILFGLAVVIGFFLLIIPGVYVVLRYGHYMLAIVDRDLGVMESFKYSFSITTNNWSKILILGLAALGIGIAGALALIVGLVFAIPLTYLAWVVAYRWMQYGRLAASDEPGTTTPMLSAGR